MLFLKMEKEGLILNQSKQHFYKIHKYNKCGREKVKNDKRKENIII